MQSVSVTIDVKPQEIPELVCLYHQEEQQNSRYKDDIACAVAEALGVQEYLSRSDRIAELRRTLWERNPSF